MSAAPSQRAPNGQPPAGVSREKATADLVRSHFEIEPELRLVYAIRARNESDAREPIALLEVNASTFPSGSVTPFAFTQSESIPFPVLIAEITPAELDAVRDGALRLPDGWTLEDAKPFERPAK